jgi:hypothetical protein
MEDRSLERVPVVLVLPIIMMSATSLCPVADEAEKSTPIGATAPTIPILSRHCSPIVDD